MGPDATGLGQIFWYTLENKKFIKTEILCRTQVYSGFCPYLLQGVEGVSEVAGIGGFTKEYQIDVDPNKPFCLRCPFSTLTNAIQNSNIDVGAEVIEDGD